MIVLCVYDWYSVVDKFKNLPVLCSVDISAKPYINARQIL